MVGVKPCALKNIKSPGGSRTHSIRSTISVCLFSEISLISGYLNRLFVSCLSNLSTKYTLMHMFPDWKSAKFVSYFITQQQRTTHPKSIGIEVNYRTELSLIAASLNYSPKATTMKLTITDDIEVIAEYCGSIQGLYVSLDSFSFDVMWFRKVEDRNSFSAICQNSVITPSITRWRTVGREKYTRILALSHARVYFSRPIIHRRNFLSSHSAPPVTTQRT